jgi:hypothetical protein
MVATRKIALLLLCGLATHAAAMFNGVLAVL